MPHTARTGSLARAVSDVPRPAERLAPHRAPPPKAPAGNDLDDYFDRLDAAFANIATPAEKPPPRQSDVTPRREGPVMERDLDWFDPPSQADAPPASARQVPPSHEPPQVIDAPPAPAVAPAADPVPVTFASPPVSPSWPLPQPASIEPPDSPPSRAPQPARSAEAAPSLSADRVFAVADAFSALLAAEQGDPDAPPVRLPVTSESAPVSSELVDEIVRRVVERLGPPAVHDVVADVVSRIAERLVREEIERIRNKHTGPEA